MLVNLDEFMVKRGGSINPIKFVDETFELLSIPAFDKGVAEIVKGGNIGSSKKCVEPNDILLSKIVPHIRRCWVVPPAGKFRQIASGEWIQFRSNQLTPDYLRFFLISDSFHCQFMNTVSGVGGSLLRASPTRVANIKIPLPPLAEQQKIAAILDAADSLRQKDQQLIEHYTTLGQSLFLEMFGDPVSNPMGWEISTIEKVLEGKSQNGLYLTKDKYQPNGIEMVHMSDAFYEIVNPGSLKKVELTAQEMEKYKLSANDLLLARRSLTYEGAAKPCLIPEYDKPLVYESSLIRISPKLQKVNTLYLYFFFSNQRARNKFINKYISRSTISGINNKGLNSIKIPLPPITLQNQFAERIQAIEAQKQQAQASLEKSETLFNSLLQRAFKGELTA